MPRILRDVAIFSAVDPATADVSDADTFRLISDQNGVPFISSNGAPYAPIPGGAPGSNDFILTDNVALACQFHVGAEIYLGMSTLNGAEQVFFGVNGVLGLAFSVNLRDNATNAFRLQEGNADYVNLDTLNGAEAIRIGESGVLGLRATVNVRDNTAGVFAVTENGNDYAVLSTLNGAERWEFGPTAGAFFDVYAPSAGGAIRLIDFATGGEWLNADGTPGAEILTLGDGFSPTLQVQIGGTTPLLCGNRAIRLGALGADPAAVAGNILVYGKTTAGVTEMYYRKSDGTVVGPLT